MHSGEQPALAGSGRTVRYLSVHDLVWIHTALVGAPAAFDYERLESCMAAQYGYGDSTDVGGQACALLHRCLRERPFDCANRPLAVVAVLAFLAANGMALGWSDEELTAAAARIEAGEDLVAPVRPSASHASASIRSIVTATLAERAALLRALGEGAG